MVVDGEEPVNRVQSARIAAAIVIGSLSATIGGTAATAAPLPTTEHSLVGRADSRGIATIRPLAETVPSGPTGQLPADTPKPGLAPRAGIPIGPIINFIKSAGPSIWTACVKAAKAGWSKTVAWWNGLASWIRSGIAWLTNVTAQSILQAIIDWVLHH